jgi:PAS domain S-box-containing protein
MPMEEARPTPGVRSGAGYGEPLPYQRPARTDFSSQRTILLVSLVMLFAVVASAAMWLQAERSRDQLRQQVMEQAQQRSLHLADAMAGQVGTLLSLFDLALVDLRREWLRDPVLFDPIAREVINTLPGGFVTHATVVDADGRLVYNSLWKDPAGDLSDHPHLLEQKALVESTGTDRMLISKPMASHIEDDWAFVVSRPIVQNGRFAGVVRMMVSTSSVSQKLAKLQLSDEDVVALILPDGTFLSRSRGNTEAMGQQVGADRPYVRNTEQERGTYRDKGHLDGMERSYGWQRIAPHGLVVVIGLADSSVLAPLAPAFERGRLVSGVLTALLLLSGALISTLLWRVQRHQSLLQAQEAFRHRLFESSMVPIVVMSADNATVLDCNSAAVRIYGFPDRESVKSSTPLMFSAPVQYDGTPSRDKAARYIRQAIKKGSVVFDWLHQRPDGTQWDAEVRLMSFESDGQWLLQFTLQDITDRRKAEAALKRSETRLKEAQTMAHVGNWESDPGTRRILWSDELFRIFEVPPDFVPTYESFLAMVHPEDRDMVVQAYVASLKNFGPFEVVHRLLMPDGRVKYVRESGMSEFENGRAVRSLGAVHDITEMRMAEDQLKRLNEELEQRVAERTREMTVLNRDLEAFAYSVSHDLRTPLRSIDGYASLLEAECGEHINADGHSYLERIRHSARRMGNLINDMLTMAHLNRAELQRERLDLSEMARSVVVELTAGDHSRQVQWHIEDGLVVEGDAALIRAVLQNLLGNAWKYTGHTAEVRISLTRQLREDGTPEFCVRDNGAGFDMAYAHQLFQPFKRLHAQHEFEGTGVGLATVHRIVVRHGGQVRAEGKVGEGALFCFTLPGAVKVHAD